MIKDVILYLVRQQPFYAHLLNQMQLLEDSHVPIAGCSISEGNMYLHLNLEVFNQLTLENKTYILVHELLHLIGRHTTRIRNRQKLIWNIACDVAVNQYIAGIPIKQKVKMKVNYDKGGVITQEREVGGVTLDNVTLPNGIKVSLPAKGFAEQYYNLLIEQMDEGSGSGSAELQGNRQLDGNRSGLPGELSQLSELHSTWPYNKASCQAIEEAVLSRAVDKAANSCEGKIPGHVQEEIARQLKTETPWRRILQHFLARQTSEERFSTFKKPNKRLYQYELPGLKRNRRLRIVVALDTSGSIGSAELAGFVAEVERIRQCGAEVILIECDCKVQRVYPLKRKINLSFKGRGGTDFRPVWEHIKSKGLRPDAIIYLTDGRGQAPTHSLYPTLWALTKDGVLPWMSSAKEIREVNWGKPIRIHIS